MRDSRAAAQLKVLDQALLGELVKVSKQPLRQTPFRSIEVGRLAKKAGKPAGFKELKASLEKAKTFELRIERHSWKDTDKEKFRFTLVRAATTGMWPMGTNYWVRDNVLIGARLMFGEGKAASITLGREILLSTLTFMSSATQLARFESIIRSKSKKVIRDAAHWPVIFASISKNLNARVSEPWAHKQDAWQMLAWYVFDAIEAGLISIEDLSRKHVQFLGLVVPFLGKVRFWEMENSGSWEEVPAVRSSVIAWEHRLVVRMAEFARRREFRFLSKAFDRRKAHLGSKFSKHTFDTFIEWMNKHATARALEALPFESPDYKKRDPRYRKADAALIYLLQLDYPAFIAAHAGKSKAWAQKMESKLLAQIESLYDPRTGGIRRYLLDSYQRSGFFRHSTVQGLAEMYGSPSGDASSQMVGRDQIVPKGREAAWVHFVWQLSAWAGRAYLAKQSAHYRKMHEFYFREGLRLVTGKNEASVDQDATGASRVIRIEAGLMPECYISDVGVDGEELVFPSPHTPLNWAVGEMRDAFAVRERVLEAHSRS